MSQDYHTPASRLQEPPTVAEERAQRQANRDKMAAYLKARPNEELTAGELERVVENYQQRISDCRRQLGMNIPYKMQWIERQDGSKQRITGVWRYQPYESLGPSSDQYRVQPRLI